MKEIEVVIDTEEIAEFFYEQLIEEGTSQNEKKLKISQILHLSIY